MRRQLWGGGPVAWAALILSMAAIVANLSGLAGAASVTIGGGSGPSKGRGHAHPARAGQLVRLGRGGKIPARYLPALDARRLDGLSASQLAPTCPPTSVDVGTWCLMAAPYPLTNADVGKNDYFWASQQCVALGGFLPTAAQLIGAADRVKLESVINDNPLTATVEQDPSLGLQDQREMSATLVTTAAGSDAAGSEGVSAGSTGNPNLGQPNPTPEPADPAPETLQYVTVYDNFNHGGFAGSEPVSQPENFRCAFDKVPGAASENTQ